MAARLLLEYRIIRKTREPCLRRADRIETSGFCKELIHNLMLMNGWKASIPMSLASLCFL